MVTTPEFWDCNCSGRYIHAKDHSCCPTCGAKRDDQPDSRPEEVLKSSLLWKPREEPPYEDVASTVERLDAENQRLQEQVRLLRSLLARIGDLHKSTPRREDDPHDIHAYDPPLAAGIVLEIRDALEATKEGA